VIGRYLTDFLDSLADGGERAPLVGSPAIS
jgi:hypothetical protein